MSYAPIFALANTSSAVKGLLKTGNGPLRFYLFGEADQNTPKPYAVWQTVGGSPENYLGQVPDIDSWTVQVDAYANDAVSARNVATALINALEPAAHVTSYNGEYREIETRLYRFSFTVDFITPR